MMQNGKWCFFCEMSVFVTVIQLRGNTMFISLNWIIIPLVFCFFFFFNLLFNGRDWTGNRWLIQWLKVHQTTENPRWNFEITFSKNFQINVLDKVLGRCKHAFSSRCFQKEVGDLGSLVTDTQQLFVLLMQRVSQIHEETLEQNS